jgi:PPOX class probable F420-dependent enzyme
MAGANSGTLLSPQVQRLAALPILTVIATKREDGSIQLNPIWFELRDGYFVVNSNTRRAWPRNLQRQKEATFLLVDPDTDVERYAQIHGRLVEVTPDPKVEVINRLSRRYTGKPFRELEPGEERITFKIEPVRVTGQMI